jgi:NAD(P)-dependent dehydrogenase (short-subunit alcohol dehydrogenase family)
MLSLVTGVGAKGQVGEAVAGALAARGDTVVIVSRSAEEVAARAAELGANVRGFSCDLSDPASVDKLATAVAREFGASLDALVNLAGGFAASGPLAQSDPGQLRKQLDINFTTAYLATRAFLPMLAVARGSIVYFASESVLEGAKTSGVSAYAASKAAVVALMRSVADEGREAGVRANALAPGAIRTATNEASMGSKTRYVEREDVAATVAFFCSPASRAISGQLIRLR